MPLIYVQRYAQAQTVAGGTQAVSNVFNLTGETAFILDPIVFTAAGSYTLVTYLTFNYPGAYATGQAALNALVLPYVDVSALGGLTVSTLIDDPVAKTITVTLI